MYPRGGMEIREALRQRKQQRMAWFRLATTRLVDAEQGSPGTPYARSGWIPWYNGSCIPQHHRIAAEDMMPLWHKNVCIACMHLPQEGWERVPE